MFSVLIRLALTAALVALAALVASNWQNHWQRQLNDGLTNMLVIGSLIVLGGLVVAVWSFKTRLFGLVVRAVLSVPPAGFAVLIVVWVQPFHDMSFSGTAFFAAMIVACVLLIAAMWSYWPKKP